MRSSTAAGIGTGYGHMSRIAVYAGERVRRGQVIGYVGSTGLSTGPHLHYEMYRSGAAVNPASVAFVTRAQLSGGELARVPRRARRAASGSTPGAALADLSPGRDESAAAAPVREIDRLERKRDVG